MKTGRPWKESRRRMHARIEVKADPNLHLEQYDITLLEANRPGEISHEPE